MINVATSGGPPKADPISIQVSAKSIHMTWIALVAILFPMIFTIPRIGDYQWPVAIKNAQMS
jgi:hypothetical protein